MSDDVKDRARDALARAIPYGHGINKGITDKALAALDAAGIALVDANCECVSRGYTDHVETRMRNDASTIAILCDKVRRLLEFRDAVDGFETALGVWENCTDAHCGVGGFCDEQKRSLAEALQHKGAARAAVADIESEGG